MLWCFQDISVVQCINKHILFLLILIFVLLLLFRFVGTVLLQTILNDFQEMRFRVEWNSRGQNLRFGEKSSTTFMKSRKKKNGARKIRARSQDLNNYIILKNIFSFQFMQYSSS